MELAPSCCGRTRRWDRERGREMCVWWWWGGGVKDEKIGSGMALEKSLPYIFLLLALKKKKKKGPRLTITHRSKPLIHRRSLMATQLPKQSIFGLYELSFFFAITKSIVIFPQCCHPAPQHRMYVWRKKKKLYSYIDFNYESPYFCI